MDDSETVLGADAPDLRKVMEKGVDEGSEPASRPRMDEESAGLVDDGDVLVGVDHIQGNELRFEGRSRRELDFRRDQIAGTQFVARLAERPVDRHLVFIDEPLELRPGKIPDLTAQEDVEAIAFPVIPGDAEKSLIHATVS